jgi:hypothetical protein
MPFGEIGEEKRFMRISRRSLCDECTDQGVCISLQSRRTECERFRPKEIVFNDCRACGRAYEVHESMRNDFLDECPECGEKRRQRRLLA